MATHSSVLAWRIPGLGEPDGLLSMGSHRVGHDWSDLAAAAVADGTRGHDLSFLILSFKLAFSLSYFTLVKRFFSPSLLSAIRVVSSAYLRLLIFLLAIFIPACNSSRLAFHLMGSAYKLNKQGDNIQPCHTTFSILNQSFQNCSLHGF